MAQGKSTSSANDCAIEERGKTPTSCGGCLNCAQLSEHRVVCGFIWIVFNLHTTIYCEGDLNFVQLSKHQVGLHIILQQKLNNRKQKLWNLFYIKGFRCLTLGKRTVTEISNCLHCLYTRRISDDHLPRPQMNTCDSLSQIFQNFYTAQLAHTHTHTRVVCVLSLYLSETSN
jgi:hypothetical protein